MDDDRGPAPAAASSVAAAAASATASGGAAALGPEEIAARCRLFYEKRVRVAESFREDLAESTSAGSSNSSSGGGGDSGSGNPRLADAMQQLRRQIATLMTEDNALFEQLLTLNDSIAALKEQQLAALQADSRCSSLDSLSDPEVADQSASPTSTLSSSSSTVERYRPAVSAAYPPTPPLRRFSLASLGRQHPAPRPLQIVTKDSSGRLVLLRPCKAAGAIHLTRVDVNCPYDSGFHGSESDAENNEIFV